ncbi:hypothetical protein VN12_04600 [Pirellula sp. SH-Sr6A]|uniref:hypothetical protein n=1 Tax=Pirellula sp. SH-Sr6A TaxID=1632865 RepID=UPI00078DC46E|nr:hypothetical protein [Pirellula sp. SH-Sr6A]AMV31374.1 hypothetical protein VN12_04600 [Pirellula sp. SH-Sr6A]
MRFLQFRQLLRGLLAASLAIAGTSADIAFAGIQNTPWNQVCFLNDREYDPWESGFSGEPIATTLKGIACEFEFDDCIRADRFQIDRQVVYSLLHHHLPRLHCSAWIHGFRTTGSGLGAWLTRQYELGRAARGHLSQLALVVGTGTPSLTAPSGDGWVEASFPKRDLDGNLFVYVFEEELANTSSTEDLYRAEQTSDGDLEATLVAAPALVTNFDSCFAESHFANASIPIPSGADGEIVASDLVVEPHCQQPAESVGGQPPILEGDRLALTDASKEPDACIGLGHCTIPGAEPAVVEPVAPEFVLAQVVEGEPDSMDIEQGEADAEVELLVSDESEMLRNWIAPDWNIRSWELRTHGPRYEYKLEGFAAKPMFPPEGLLLDIGQPSLVQSSVEKDMEPQVLAEDALVADVLVEETLIEEALVEGSPFEAWFSAAWSSMVAGVYDRLSGWEPAAQELSLQSTRIVSRKLKNLGMLLIQSADRLDQAAIPIGIAGRAGTQR